MAITTFLLYYTTRFMWQILQLHLVLENQQTPWFLVVHDCLETCNGGWQGLSLFVA